MGFQAKGIQNKGDEADMHVRSKILRRGLCLQRKTAFRRRTGWEIESGRGKERILRKGGKE